MFITVTYGEDQKEIFNHQCRIVNLVESIKQKCNCGAEVCIDLIDEAGNLMNLSDQQTSTEFASNYLTTQKKYILIQVKRDDFESCKYESLLKNLEQRHPELAGEEMLSPLLCDLRKPRLSTKMLIIVEYYSTEGGQSVFRTQAGGRDRGGWRVGGEAGAQRHSGRGGS
uniref:Uncharacterized protein n=1 Tax=Callorhinchus milii TaxID=7868 RepID=A0A4W3J5T5_CALMI